jgi:hypothetical protein
VAVSTHVGQFEVDGLPADATAWHLQQKLYELGEASGRDVPPASEQALVR